MIQHAAKLLKQAVQGLRKFTKYWRSPKVKVAINSFPSNIFPSHFSLTFSRLLVNSSVVTILYTDIKITIFF